MKRIFLIMAFLIGFIDGQQIQKTGTTAAQFLKIDIGPRAVAMGGAFTATASDISAIYWNPAGLALVQNNGQASFTHVEWFAGIKMDFAAFALALADFGTVGAQIISVNAIDGQEVRTEESPEGTGELFDAGALSIGVSYAFELTNRFAMGFNTKYIREYIWNSSASSIAFDVGLLYRIDILNEFRIGASVSNFGGKMRMDGRDVLEIRTVGGDAGNLINTKIELDEWDLPLLFRVGVASDIFKDERSRITFGLDAVHPNDHSEYVNSGIEYALNEQAFIRAGYKSLFEEDTEQGLTFGAGLQYGLSGGLKVKIDYAYQDFGVLDVVHHVAFGVNF